MSPSLRQTRKGALVNLQKGRFGAGIALAFCLCALLAGCGKRPSKVLPPEGVNEAETVRVYPNPALDPAPAQEGTPAITSETDEGGAP